MKVDAGSFAAAVVAVSLTVAGCDRKQVVAPDLQARVSGAPAPGSERPFYYYLGQPVYLDVDSSAFIVEADSASAEVAVRDALDGLAVASVNPTPQARTLYLVRLVDRPNADAHRAALARLRSDSRLTFAVPALRWSEDRSPVTLVNGVIVQFRQGVSGVAALALADSLGLEVRRAPLPDSGFSTYIFRYPRGSDPLAIAARLSEHPLVEWADPDKYAARRLTSPTDPYYGLQYYLRNGEYSHGVRVDDNVERAWTITKGSSSIRVYVLDSGIDINHQDLSGPGCGPLVQGYDTFSEQGEDAWHPRHATPDDHGTAVAGIIHACHDNGMGVAGIAPNVALGSIRIFRDGQANTDVAIGNAITWAWYSAQADVLVNSWAGGAPSMFISAAINGAATYGRGGKGAAVVFAAGDSSIRSQGVIGPVLYPATLSMVLAVGAIDRSGALADYSPEGPALDVVAPSGHYGSTCFLGDVQTTDLWSAGGCDDGGPNQNDLNFTSTFSGTSAACPQVAGAIALLLSNAPNMVWVDVQTRVRSMAVPWGPASQYGGGKLDIDHMLWPYDPVSVSVSGPSIITVKGTYTWTANPSGGDHNYAYQWQLMTLPDSSVWNLGTQQTQTRTVSAGMGQFAMIVTITSVGRSGIGTRAVTECIGNPGGCYEE
jgi:subtilisin family serine protease